MKIIEFIQFYGLSTGYIKGTTPPQFDNDHRRPIELLGSDGILILDRRFTLENKHKKAEQESMKRKHAVGYQLMRGSSFSDAKQISQYIAL